MSETAYAQSQQAGIALMQSVQREQSEMEWLESLKSQHKRAFRVPFDLLEKMWPPENTVDYWTMVTDRMALIYNENKDNRLCKAFLLALTGYLEEIGKEREQRGISGVSENKEDCQ